MPRDDPRRGRGQAEAARDEGSLKIVEVRNNLEIEPAGKLLNFTKAASASALRGLLRFRSPHRSRGLVLAIDRSFLNRLDFIREPDDNAAIRVDLCRLREFPFAILA